MRVSYIYAPYTPGAKSSIGITHMLFQKWFSQEEEKSQALRCKLETMMSIVEHYQKNNSMGTLETHITDLSPFMNVLQLTWFIVKIKENNIVRAHWSHLHICFYGAKLYFQSDDKRVLMETLIHWVIGPGYRVTLLAACGGHGENKYIMSLHMTDIRLEHSPVMRYLMTTFQNMV